MPANKNYAFNDSYIPGVVPIFFDFLLQHHQAIRRYLFSALTLAGRIRIQRSRLGRKQRPESMKMVGQVPNHFRRNRSSCIATP